MNGNGLGLAGWSVLFLVGSNRLTDFNPLRLLLIVDSVSSKP